MTGNHLTRAGDLGPLPGMPPHLRLIATNGADAIDAEVIARYDRQENDADAAAYAEMRERQQAFRSRAWDETCPVRFRRATLVLLEQHQDPQGVVSGWLGSQSANLVLHGPSRRGKSHTAHAVGHAARRQGLWVVSYTAKTLLDFLRPSQMDPARPERTRMMVADADLLILDELGVEKLDTEFAVAEITDVVDTRISAAKRLIVTTNLDDHKLVGRYGDRVVYRLIELATIVEVDGPVMHPRALFGG